MTGAVGLAAGGLAYAALWPGSRIFGEALVAPARAGELALTFDDGPNPAWTPRLLDALARYDARATFFMMGSRAQTQPDLVRRIAAAGAKSKAEIVREIGDFIAGLAAALAETRN